MKQTIYLSSAYLAPVEYYARLYSCEKAFIEQHDHYIKQTYRNRCTIASADGPLTLSVPIEKPETLKCAMKDIRVSDHGNWRHLHWTAIESAYSNSPFFEYYKDDFAPFYEQKQDFLYDFNEDLCHLVCELLDIHPHIERTLEYKQEFLPEETDFRECIHPKKAPQPGFTAHPYYQVFEVRHGFLPNLSIIDLVFNMGPEGLLVLRDANK